MRPPCPLPPSAEKKLPQLLDPAVMKTDYRRVLCVWLRAVLGMSAAEMATALGWSMGTVHKLHSQDLHEGTSALVGCGRGGRRRQLLTVAEEEKLLTEFVTRAEQGDLTEGSAIRVARSSKSVKPWRNPLSIACWNAMAGANSSHVPFLPLPRLAHKRRSQKAPASGAQRGGSSSRTRLPPAADVCG